MNRWYQQQKALIVWLKVIRGKGITLFFSVIVSLIFLFTTTLLPVQTAKAFSVKEEQELGDKLLYSVRGAFDLVDDPDIYQYINTVGAEVLAVTGVQYFNYHFFVIDSKEFNAFAAPSGLIFFYSGLIAAMNSEDEFVAVLAHEIGHSVKRHLAARADSSKVSSVAAAGIALIGILAGGPLAPALILGGLATGQSIALGYSRANEEEADLLAYGWMKDLGRDPAGQIKMLSTMRRVARYRSQKLPQYLLTHPNPEARLDYVESLYHIDQTRGDRVVRKQDDFAFFRFKYRIMAQVKESGTFRDLLVSQFTSDRSTEFQRKIAEYGLALIALQENNFDVSIEHIDKAIKNFPDKEELIGDRGYILLEAGRLAEAERELKSFLKKKPGDLFATFNMGKLMARKGDYKRAEKYYQSILYEMPEFSKAYYELGRLANGQGQLGSAAFYLGKYNLYKGKFKLAQFNFKQAGKLESTPSDQKRESKKLLKTIDDILKDR